VAVAARIAGAGVDRARRALAEAGSHVHVALRILDDRRGGDVTEGSPGPR
jgi:hypothetical protein